MCTNTMVSIKGNTADKPEQNFPEALLLYQPSDAAESEMHMVSWVMSRKKGFNKELQHHYCIVINRKVLFSMCSFLLDKVP